MELTSHLCITKHAKYSLFVVLLSARLHENFRENCPSIFFFVKSPYSLCFRENFYEIMKNLAKTSNFLKVPRCCLTHIFAKTFGETNICKKSFVIVNNFAIFMPKLIFLCKSAEVSCHQNIFTKVVPLFHFPDKFSIFIIKIRKSQHLLIYAKI